MTSGFFPAPEPKSGAAESPANGDLEKSERNGTRLLAAPRPAVILRKLRRDTLDTVIPPAPACDPRPAVPIERP
jgi:hypothetical protein